MWITLNICLYLSFTCISVAFIPSSNSCQLQGKFKLNGMYQDGDFLIGGLFEVQHLKVFPELNFKAEPELPDCEEFYLASFQQAQTMVFAINEINNNHSLLPNITLGYQIYDNCLRLGVAFRAAIDLISGTEESFSNLNCTGPPPVIGIIGDPGSTQSIAISSVLGLFRVPIVSYYATCSCLSDRNKYPSFFRTIPSDAFQVRAMIQILKHFGWTWVGLLYSDDDYGIYAAQSFHQEMQVFGGCVAFSEILPYDNNHRDIQRIVEVIQTSTARVVVAFSTDLLSLMDELLLQNVTGKQWIASEAWTTTPVLHTPHYLPLLGGTLGIAIRRGEIQGLCYFLLHLHPDNNPKNSMKKIFWENMFGCKFDVRGKKVEQEQEQGRKVCTGQEDLSSTDTSYNDVSELRASYNVYKAVYALAHALHDLMQCEEGRGPFSGNSCANINKLQPWQIVHYLQKVNFTTGFGDHVSFDKNGDALAIYDVMNWQPSSDGSIIVRTVGVVDEGAATGKVLTLDEDALYWNFETKNPPRSVCSESCPPGTRRAMRKGLPVCCFDCLPCADGEISYTTDSTECVMCPNEFWSSPENDRCVPKEVEFLSYKDPLGISLTTASLLGTSFCALVMVIFAHHRNTPVVRANNSELSFLLLCSLKLCFLCVLLYIGQPQLWTCQLRHAVFGISFVLCISSILVKTMVVIAVFKSSRPEGKATLKWFGAAQQRGTIVALTTTQVAICTVWLSTASPTPHKNSQYISSKIVYECAIGSVAGFCLLLGYICLLAAVSFMLAFMARKLPDHFNEAKFITFSMLIFCAVWITFIPAYVSSPGKYSVAVEIFAILASSFGLLLAIFAPKCYIIILHPERNTKKAIMGRVTQKI
ncbi:extracellular calcium-sensing receptor-like [Xyrauchen texanus]|uniref:extracellular calcium-sensing receptor-like n=1 Tax=Xyrauchen texanus TaxID=154827 RepID=UPI002241A10B|nr:extracellular calcium-sensing receptor-like [Xyrauchen texanus]